jgi:uncharacterized protein YndB with AHSA1/START domain
MSNRTLFIKRTFATSRETIWRCWVEGDLLKQWYCPKPWYVSVAQLDVRPGGASFIVMNGPNGEENRLRGQYVEVVEGYSLTFTDAYVGDWIHNNNTPFMTGYVILTDAPYGGTQMEWGARHWTDETTEQHKAMGFEAGWNAAADQLEELACNL